MSRSCGTWLWKRDKYFQKLRKCVVSFGYFCKSLVYKIIFINFLTPFQKIIICRQWYIANVRFSTTAHCWSQITRWWEPLNFRGTLHNVSTQIHRKHATGRKSKIRRNLKTFFSYWCSKLGKKNDIVCFINMFSWLMTPFEMVWIQKGTNLVKFVPAASTSTSNVKRVALTSKWHSTV